MTGAGDEGAPFPPADGPDIPNADDVYRRLSDSGPNMVRVDLETGERRPSSGAFKPDPDGVSVYRRSLLEGAGLAANDVIRNPWNLVVRVNVGEIRSIELGVRDDPWPPDIDEPDHLRNAAHALITGLERLGKSRRVRRQRDLVKLPSVAIIVG